MKRTGQVLIIILWILLILTILAVSIGHRVSLALRISRYQKDRLTTLYLAKAGINRAIAEIINDQTPDFDSLNDNWADNADIFKKITLKENQSESAFAFATVSYKVKEGNQEKTVFGAIDEERKININVDAAPKDLIAELLNKTGITDYTDIANNICAWRGDTGVSVPDYADLGYPNKGDKFVNIEELILVKDINKDIYTKIKDLITVWGSGKANINTASRTVLDILIEYCKKQIPVDNDPRDLADRIMLLRLNTAFASFSDLETKLRQQAGLSSGQVNILDKMQTIGDFKSSCFYIKSNGKISTNNFTSMIDCVFDRNNNKIIYWHEN